MIVSTHSRLKAAGLDAVPDAAAGGGFNTQPPEGGWSWQRLPLRLPSCRFNTQPPEGGWGGAQFCQQLDDGFNTQPPEGGWPAGHVARPRP